MANEKGFDYSIQLRINDKQKVWLQVQSYLQKRPLVYILREMIDKHMVENPLH